MSRDWPLRGREGELNFIRRALGASKDAGVMLVGPIGAGRTRLLQEVASAASASGMEVHATRGSNSAATIPLGAMTQLLPPLAGPAHDTAQLLHIAVRHQMEIAKDRRVVLTVDDAHLLDDTSATLVYQLAASGLAFVVAAATSGSRVPDPIFALWKDRLTERLDVNPLTRNQFEELLTAVLGGVVDDGTLHQLWQLSLGHPLFLRELVDGGLESGELSRQDDIWRWRGSLTAPPRLIDLVETRMGRLASGERGLTEMLAFGEPLEADLISAAGGTPVLVSCERRGLLLSEQRGRRVEIRLAHPVYAEVVRRTTSARRSRDVHRFMAECLARSPSLRRGDRVRLASWRLMAGLVTDAAELVTASNEALELRDYQSAERLSAAAVDLGGGGDAAGSLGRALVGLGRSVEADLALDVALSKSRDGVERSRFAVIRATNLFWGLADSATAEQVLQDAESTASSETVRTNLLAMRATLSLHKGRTEDSLAELDQVLNGSEVDDTALLVALAAATPALSLTGRSVTAIESAERGLRLEQTVTPLTPWELLQLEAGRVWAYAWAGRLSEAQRFADEGHQRALARGWPVAKAQFALWRGHVARMQGRNRSAVHCLREAASTNGDDASLYFRPAILGNLALATAVTGDGDAAEAAAEAAEASLAQSSSHMFWALPAIARAWAAAARGETTRAADLLQAVAKNAAECGQHHYRLFALHDVVRLDGARDVLDEITTVASTMEGAIAPICVAHAQALVDGDGAGLDRVADLFRGIGANLLAAETSAHAARCHRDAGRLSSALASDTRSRQWAEQCEGASTPALSIPDQPRYLTSREMEIARLAASGLTSKAIADRLVVSVRTVDNVLHCIYGKLSISGRRELPSVIGVASVRRGE